ncbi:unnamed protein product [Dovyalis caffra]|uniref:BRWD/PHIP N-terminal domain-containing protein n=1 Tax=Dovyalis caffra TaxID=77055 RepID=A0AAV1SAF6_9ROSI|nr:unnamed protein product [Dovyalis caffra]
MDIWNRASSGGASSINKAPLAFSKTVMEKAHFEQQGRVRVDEKNLDVDRGEVYFLILRFLSSGPFHRTSRQFRDEVLEHELLPRRYHAWFSRSGAHSWNDNDDGVSLPLSYDKLAERYRHIEKDHLVKLLKQLLLNTDSMLGEAGGNTLNAAHVPTILGSGERSMHKQAKPLPTNLRWPHMQIDQVHGLSLREIGGGSAKHHHAPSICYACYAIAKPLTMVQKMQNTKKLRGHRPAVHCVELLPVSLAIFDPSGRYVITGSDDRLVKIWSMETAFCLASCRGPEGDITDLAVSSNNALVASASNDFVIRVWRLPDGVPISVLQGHTGAVTAIAFSPRLGSVHHLLSSSMRCSDMEMFYSIASWLEPRVYLSDLALLDNLPICLFVGHQMMELVEFGMLDVPNVVHEFIVPKPSDALTGKSVLLVMDLPQVMVHRAIRYCVVLTMPMELFLSLEALILMLEKYFQVWNACKSNTDVSEQPIHEMDVLSGHENDVNCVQFRSSMSDTLKEDSGLSIDSFPLSVIYCQWSISRVSLILRFCHEKIVTCSHDGNAIIWRSISRRSHPYVLDVHPFNPRIAMSAGYDGRTIGWDMWEGIPIHIYEIGRVKLVDGKFSPDGTSIVLSDDVGQIHLLNTGQGESQKYAKYDQDGCFGYIIFLMQFFLGDYRPLIRDVAGNILDQYEIVSGAGDTTRSTLKEHRRSSV